MLNTKMPVNEKNEKRVSDNEKFWKNCGVLGFILMAQGYRSFKLP
jgi:hypothetical protein